VWIISQRVRLQTLMESACLLLAPRLVTAKGKNLWTFSLSPALELSTLCFVCWLGKCGMCARLSAPAPSTFPIYLARRPDLSTDGPRGWPRLQLWIQCIMLCKMNFRFYGSNFNYYVFCICSTDLPLDSSITFIYSYLIRNYIFSLALIYATATLQHCNMKFRYIENFLYCTHYRYKRLTCVCKYNFNFCCLMLSRIF